MDIKHVLSRNPLLPAYDTVCPVRARADRCFRLGRVRRWGPPRSAMPVTASASTTNGPATRPSWALRPGRPAGDLW